MSQGTLSLTNGSKDVTGTNTAFTSDTEAGGWLIFHVGGMPFTVAVESVQSDTELTLSDNFDGATATGIGYSGVPLSALIQIPALTSIQARDAIRRMMMNDANFQQLLTGPDDVTINRPDGSTFSGPSWPKIVELLNGVDIDQITALANQISDDAIQVAADKTAAETANSSAQSAKTLAESAAASANADKVDAANSASYANSRAAASEASALRAENAADSIDTSNFLRKDDNLGSVASKLTSRRNLELDRFSQGASRTAMYSANTGYFLAVTDTGDWGAYSQETQSKVALPIASGGTGGTTDSGARTALKVFSKDEINARIGYALITTSSNAALNSRTVFENPFGNNTPVICEAEIYHATQQKWMSGAWIFNPAQGGGGSSYGIRASYAAGEGISLRTGNFAFMSTDYNSGTNIVTPATNYLTPSPIRIHVWKVTA